MADIRGDLHYHTDLSGDGESSLDEMVAAAATRGYSYVAIADHGENLAINGSSRSEMLAHRDAIRAIQADYPDMRILFGCELNIGPDGSLDYRDEVLAAFDFVIGSVHSNFTMTEAKMTDRICRLLGLHRTQDHLE